MIWTIEYNNKKLELEVEKFTQLCGENLIKKEKIIQLITDYFSTKKAKEFSSKLLINGEEISSGYYEIINIKSEKDIKKFITDMKKGFLIEFINDHINDIKYATYINSIDEIVMAMLNEINKSIENDIGNIEVDIDRAEIKDYLKELHVEDNIMDSISTVDLYNSFINLVIEQKRNSGKNIIIILDNLERCMDAKDYNNVVRYYLDKINYYNNFYIMSIVNYGSYFYNYDGGINIINDEIFILPNEEKMKEFIEEYYPCNLDEFKIDELYENISVIINYIGKKHLININEVALLSEINKSIGEKVDVVYYNDIVLNYIKSMIK